MIKSKWLRIQCLLSPQKVSEAILGRAFDQDNERGFIGLSKKDQCLFAKYTERTIVRESSVDPFGELSELESVRYSIIPFRLHFNEPFDEDYILEVNQPPRTIRPLLQELSDILDGVVVHEPNIPLMDVYMSLKMHSFKARIVKLRASGIAISSTTALKVEALSSTDAYVDFISRFGQSTLKLEKIRIENPFPAPSAPLELGANGLCSFDERVETEVRSLMLDSYRQTASTRA